MTQTEYEQKKRECWEQFSQDNPAYDLPYCKRNYEIAFDRAYALGKQEKEAEGEGKEMLTVHRDDVIVHFFEAQKDTEDYNPALREGCNNVYQRAVGRRQMLLRLFGNKCYADKVGVANNATVNDMDSSEPEDEQHPNYTDQNTADLNSNGNISQDSANCDKHNSNRLHIAAMAMQGILSNIDLFKNVLETGMETLSGEHISFRAVAKASLIFADTLIDEAEKGGDEI